MKYIKPEINIKRFSTESIVTVSGNGKELIEGLQEYTNNPQAKVAQVSFDELTEFNK